MGRRATALANETLLGVTLQRAILAVAAADVEAGRDPDAPATGREMFRAMFKATAMASRVATLIVMWATALRDLEVDSIGVEEYAEWASEGRATVYRHMAEFRAVYGELYSDPNEIARALLRAADGRKLSPSVPIPAL